MQGQGYCDALLRLRAKNAAATDDIWKLYDRGEIPIDQARKNISTLRAELERPEWARHNIEARAPQLGSTYR
jgi:hypothetical protein